MLFNLKQYRQALYPVWQLKRLRDKPTDPYKWLRIAFYATIILTMGYVLKGCGSDPAWSAEMPQYTNIQYVNAIYMAEGGYHAQYLYGIRSIKCTGYTECRKICFTTVKRNRQRFAKYGWKNTPDFITFLGNRYCPIKGKLSGSESKLNKYWIKNVTYFLEHGGGEK